MTAYETTGVINTMVDIETMGKKPGCVITSIGAVMFDDVKVLQNTFAMNIDISDSMLKGFTVDGETIDWWFGQKPEAIRAFRKDPKPVVGALSELGRFYKLYANDGPIWGMGCYADGVTFDGGILEAAYKKVELEIPWNHRAPRCARTALRWAEEFDIWPMLRCNQLPHSALADAKHQAHLLLDVRQQMRVCFETWRPQPGAGEPVLCNANNQ